jgi:hypothetical protein
MARERFLRATTTIDGAESEPLGVTVNPEVKRKVIGDTFMKICDEARSSLRVPCP